MTDELHNLKYGNLPSRKLVWLSAAHTWQALAKKPQLMDCTSDL